MCVCVGTRACVCVWLHQWWWLWVGWKSGWGWAGGWAWMRANASMGVRPKRCAPQGRPRDAPGTKDPARRWRERPPAAPPFTHLCIAPAAAVAMAVDDAREAAVRGGHHARPVVAALQAQASAVELRVCFVGGGVYVCVGGWVGWETLAHKTAAAPALKHRLTPPPRWRPLLPPLLPLKFSPARDLGDNTCPTRDQEVGHGYQATACSPPPPTHTPTHPPTTHLPTACS